MPLPSLAARWIEIQFTKPTPSEIELLIGKQAAEYGLENDALKRYVETTFLPKACEAIVEAIGVEQKTRRGHSPVLG